jgi:hypothetical protein
VAQAARLLSVAATAIGVCPAVSLASVLALQAPEHEDIKNLGLGSERSVVIAFSADCGPCKESLPFYKRILAADGMDGKRNRIIVMSTDGVVPVSKILESAGFKPHLLVSYPRMRKLPEISDQAPELVVVDAAGKVLGTWRGRLTAAEETEVLRLASIK